MQDFGKGHARFTSPFLPPTEIQFPVSHSPQAAAGELNWSLHGDAQIRCAREGQRHIHYWMRSEFLSTLQDSDPLWWLTWELPVSQHKPSKAEFNIPPHASIFSH